MFHVSSWIADILGYVLPLYNFFLKIKFNKTKNCCCCSTAESTLSPLFSPPQMIILRIFFVHFHGIKIRINWGKKMKRKIKIYKEMNSRFVCLLHLSSEINENSISKQRTVGMWWQLARWYFKVNRTGVASFVLNFWLEHFQMKFHCARLWRSSATSGRITRNSI